MKKSSRNLLSDTSNPALEGLSSKAEEEVNYGNGVPVARDKHTGELINIRVTSTTAIGFFGPSGSGKTIFGKAIASRLHDKGRRIYNGADVKNDFQSLDNKPGVSKSLIRKMGLAGNEERHPIKKKLFMPRFLTKYYGTIPDYVEPFSLGFQDVSATDLKYLLGAGNLTGQTEAAMTNVLNQIDVSNTDFQELREVIEEQEVAPATIQSLKANLDKLENQEILSNRYRKDPLKYLNQGYAVSLGLENWRNYQRGDMYMLEFYAANLLDQLKGRRTDGEIESSLVGMFAEFHKLCPAGEDSLMKPVVYDLFTQAQRQMDMPLVIDSQTPSQIPNSAVSGPYDFVGKLSHIFIGCDQNGRPLGANEWKKVLNSVNMLNRSNKEVWRQKIRSLDRYDFLYINPGSHSSPQDCPVVRSLAPLCSHPG